MKSVYSGAYRCSVHRPCLSQIVAIHLQTVGTGGVKRDGVIREENFECDRVIH